MTTHFVNPIMTQKKQGKGLLTLRYKHACQLRCFSSFSIFSSFVGLYSSFSLSFLVCDRTKSFRPKGLVDLCLTSVALMTIRGHHVWKRKQAFCWDFHKRSFHPKALVDLFQPRLPRVRAQEVAAAALFVVPSSAYLAGKLVCLVTELILILLQLDFLRPALNSFDS